MEKENKKLESRQDVLDVWVSKWAVFVGKDVKRAVYSWSYAILIIFEEYTPTFSIYDILYSPESNFFEVMFWGLEEQHNPDIPERKYIKQQCATALDQLTYILDNISDTTS